MIRGSIASVIGLILVALGWFAMPDLQMWANRARFDGIRQLAHLFWPTPDLYDPVLFEPLDLQTGTTQVYSAIHKYPGRYALGIAVRESDLSVLGYDPMELLALYDYDLIVKVRCGDQYVLEKRFLREGHCCWWQEDYSGIDLVWYDVPEDIPMDCSLVVEVEVLRIGGVLAEAMDDGVWVYAEKRSEE